MEGSFSGVAGGGSGGEPNSHESWSQAGLCRPVLKFGGDMRGSKKVLPAWVGTDSLETKCVSLEITVLRHRQTLPSLRNWEETRTQMIKQGSKWLRVHVTQIPADKRA